MVRVIVNAPAGNNTGGGKRSTECRLNVRLCGVLLKTTSNRFGYVLLSRFKLNLSESITRRCNYCGVPRWVCCWVVYACVVRK